jgi:hypothetical protein
MPTSNIFDRTALFCNEKRADGKSRIKRIPWDIISFSDDSKAPKSTGQFISPMPFKHNAMADVTTTTIITDVVDMLYDDDDNNHIDEVTKIMYFESENDFIRRYEGVIGFYDGNESQSEEFGYPRT